MEMHNIPNSTILGMTHSNGMFFLELGQDGRQAL